MFQVPHHSYRARAVVENDHRSRTQSAPGFLHFVEVHRHVEVLFGQELGGRAAWKKAAETKALAHSSGMPFQNFAGGCTHGQLPEPRPLHPATGSVELGSAIFGVAKLSKPGRAVV